jgi:hypothetical protein
VIERLTALFGGADKNLQLAADFFLAYVFIELFRPECAFYRLFLRRGRRSGNYPSFADRGGEIVGLYAHR